MKSVGEQRAVEGGHETWIPLLDTATREVFELMLGCPLTVPTSAEAVKPEFTAMVGLAGQLSGVLSVRCDGKAAALMTSEMLGVELSKVGPEVSDALGEVCNMVAGNFKNKISGLAEGCMLSPPTVVTGTDYSLHSLGADSPGLEIRLLFESRPIVISLLIQS
jgi:chemotaxis protein CheX